jgi:pSer/pThr/pTyr-binding forkhead associated (FHA) protein
MSDFGGATEKDGLMTGASVDPTRVVEVITCPGPDCGATNPSSYRYCMKCGCELPVSVSNTSTEPGPGSTDSRPASPGPGETEEMSTTPGRERVYVTRILSGEETEVHEIEGEFVVGREEGDLAIEGDPFLSRSHFSIRQQSGAYFLVDLDSSNGTFIRFWGDLELRPGDYIMLGSQVFRFFVTDGLVPELRSSDHGVVAGSDPSAPAGSPAGGARLVRILEGGLEGEAYLLSGRRVIIGRERGDISFPDDERMSSIHASIFAQSPSPMLNGDTRRFVLRDEDSEKGVFVGIRKDWQLRPGDTFSAGRQVFRFEMGSGLGVVSPTSHTSDGPDS